MQNPEIKVGSIIRCILTVSKYYNRLARVTRTEDIPEDKWIHSEGLEKDFTSMDLLSSENILWELVL
jgi:hypothetical protein